MTRFLTGSSSKPSCETKMSDKKGYVGSKIKQKVSLDRNGHEQKITPAKSKPTVFCQVHSTRQKMSFASSKSAKSAYETAFCISKVMRLCMCNHPCFVFYLVLQNYILDQGYCLVGCLQDDIGLLVKFHLPILLALKTSSSLLPECEYEVVSQQLET